MRSRPLLFATVKWAIINWLLTSRRYFGFDERGSTNRFLQYLLLLTGAILLHVIISKSHNLRSTASGNHLYLWWTKLLNRNSCHTSLMKHSASGFAGGYPRLLLLCCCYSTRTFLLRMQHLRRGKRVWYHSSCYRSCHFIHISNSLFSTLVSSLLNIITLCFIIWKWYWYHRCSWSRRLLLLLLSTIG